MPGRLHHALQQRTCLETVQIYPRKVMFNQPYQTQKLGEAVVNFVMEKDEPVIVTDKREVRVCILLEL